MKMEIYQIRDEEKRKAVAGKLADRPPFTAPEPVEESEYRRVFSGDVECASPYEVLFRFNTVGHELFYGEKMGLSDVIRMETDAGTVHFLYDSLGVSVIDFEAERVQIPENAEETDESLNVDSARHGCICAMG